MKNEIKKLIKQMFIASERLSFLTKRPFTLDGHIIGSMGEMYAQNDYGVDLYPPSYKIHDGSWKDREVQIKATQRKSVDLKGISDLLLVFKINSDGSYEEIYNGDGLRPWNSLGHRKKTMNGEISISLVQLKKLNENVEEKDRIPRVNY